MDRRGGRLNSIFPIGCYLVFDMLMTIWSMEFIMKRNSVNSNFLCTCKSLLEHARMRQVIIRKESSVTWNNGLVLWLSRKV